MATSRGILVFPNRMQIFRRNISTSATLCTSLTESLCAKKVSSQMWLKRQFSDPYVKKARTENYRCRSAFKLLELDEKHRLLQPGFVVIDCGACPGSWTQVAVQKVCAGDPGARNSSLVIGVDLEHMVPVDGAYILHQSDFTLPATQEKIRTILNGRPVDVVLSDMAPRATGQKSLDHELIIELCFSVLLFGRKVLKPGGSLVCKIWQGRDQNKLEKAMAGLFEKVKIAKPASSRSDSAEIFLVGKNFLDKKS